MGRFIDDSMLAREASKKQRNSQFLSSKDDSELAFKNFLQREFEVVGLSESPGVDGGEPFNTVVIRIVNDDTNYQLSTTKFFAMKGITWPVGVATSQQKLVYLDDTIGIKDLKFIPTDVEKVIPLRKKGTGFEYFALGTPKNTWKEAKAADVDTSEKRPKLPLEKAPSDAFIAVTYVVEKVTFPKS